MDSAHHLLDAAIRFHLRVGADGTIVHLGPSLAKLVGSVVGRRIDQVATTDLASINLTETPNVTWVGGLARLRFTDPEFSLRGSFVEDPESDELVFAGTLDPLEGARFSELGLLAADFAASDLALDFTMLQWTRDAQVRETKLALQRLEASIARSEQLERQVGTDALTGLMNRWRFVTDLDRRLEDPRADVAIVLIDIDRFRAINDNHGHGVGDEVLRSVASRLRSVVGANGQVARLGGDEFAVMLSPVGDHEEVRRLCREMTIEMVSTSSSEQARIEVGVTIGVAVRCDETDSRDLLRHADIAVADARRTGSRSGQIGWFDPSAQAGLELRRAIADDLLPAIERNEIEPHFQPIVEMRRRTAVGFEVLSRWQHPVYGFVPPATFVEVAEQCLFAQRLDHYVLERSVRTATELSDGAVPPKLSVNFSALSLNDELVDCVKSVLSAYDFPPSRLTVEVTETAAIDSLSQTAATLQALHDTGVTISLDDFGTGYSSLTYLHELPIDVLKIDRSFVAAMSTSTKALQLIRSILHVAGSLSLPVVAEGIETEEQWHLLRSLGCDFGQGYLFARPAPAEESMQVFGAGRLPLGVRPRLPTKRISPASRRP